MTETAHIELEANSRTNSGGLPPWLARRQLFTYGALLLVCTTLTLWITLAAARIESTYLHNYGFFYDPAAYYVHNIDVYRVYEKYGLWRSLSYELTTNAKFPARTIPYLFVAPKQLITTMGHLWTQAPMLWAFLLLFSTTVLRRSRSLPFAIATTALFAGVPFLYDPSVGVGAYWLDFTAACALGSAALSLMLFNDSKRRAWMFAFGAFASLTAMSRWSSGFYLLAFLTLALPVVLWKAHGKQWQSTVASFACATLTALPGLAFTLYFWHLNTDFYKRFGFAFGAPISRSIAWTAHAIHDIMGTTLLAVSLAFIAGNLVAVARGTGDRTRVLLCTWLPLSIGLFVCIVVKAVDGVHPLVYFAPALFVAAFCGIGPISNSLWWRSVSVALIATAVTTTAYAYDTKRRMAAHPPRPLQIQQECNVALANYMISTNATSFAEFDNETVMPHMEAFFNHGKSVGWVAMFSIHEMYMKGMYPGKTPKEIAEALYKKTSQQVELVAVFTDPETAMKPDVFTNIYTATVSRYVAQQVEASPDWQFVGNAESLRGTLSVYKNLKFRAAR